jgi:hypothetical protein
MQMTLAKAYSDIVAFKIWGWQRASLASVPESFQNVSIYLSLSSNYRLGVLCASNVSMPDSRIPITVFCNQTLQGARYVHYSMIDRTCCKHPMLLDVSAHSSAVCRYVCSDHCQASLGL